MRYGADSACRQGSDYFWLAWENARLIYDSIKP